MHITGCDLFGFTEFTFFARSVHADATVPCMSVSYTAFGHRNGDTKQNTHKGASGEKGKLQTHVLCVCVFVYHLNALEAFTKDNVLALDTGTATRAQGNIIHNVFVLC